MSGFWAVGGDPNGNNPEPAPQLKIPTEARLVFATGNSHKVTEVIEVLTPLIPGLKPDYIVSSAQLGIVDVTETGTSFSANALIKAQAVAKHVDLPVLAEDSGLCVDVMNGAPGIFSARWCGKHGKDKENLELLLAQLRDIPKENRGASFVCSAILMDRAGKHHISEGVMGGSLDTSARGRNGFGYDPIFIPSGYSQSSAEISPAEKNRISHRFQAIKGLAPAIAEAIGLHVSQ